MSFIALTIASVLLSLVQGLCNEDVRWTYTLCPYIYTVYILAIMNHFMSTNKNRTIAFRQIINKGPTPTHRLRHYTLHTLSSQSCLGPFTTTPGHSDTPLPTDRSNMANTQTHIHRAYIYYVTVSEKTRHMG